MTTWADVEKGDRVRMGGKVFEVVEAKRRGKKVDVALAGHGGRFESTVKAKVGVEVVPLHDKSGRQTRWAKPAEEREAARPLLSPGDPRVRTAPKADGPKWAKPLDDEIADLVRTHLGGELIAEAVDTGEGYFVPPVDETTVQAHLVLFHGREHLPSSEASALAEHDEEHRAAVAGTAILSINHWHTERRARP